MVYARLLLLRPVVVLLCVVLPNLSAAQPRAADAIAFTATATTPSHTYGASMSDTIASGTSASGKSTFGASASGASTSDTSASGAGAFEFSWVADAQGASPEPVHDLRVDSGLDPAPVLTARADDVEFSELIGELLTTARRRPERVQRTPVAVTAFATRDLVARDVRRLSDLDALVPNLSIDNAIGTANAARISLRGVTQGDPNPTADPAVGVFFDGVYAPRLQGLLQVLHDVERIEVVRGPQGTLLGKNTIGGAINVVTQKPSFEREATAEVRVGNLDRFDTRAMLNWPITSRAALRLSLASNYDDGYQRNVVTDQRFGNDRFLGGRAQLRLVPTEDLEVTLQAEYTRQDRRPQLRKCEVVGPPAPALQPIQDLIDFQGACAEDQMRSVFASASDLTFAEDDLRSTLYSARASWEISPALSLESISSFRSQNDDIKQDLDASRQNIAQPLLDIGGDDQVAYSQELKLVGETFDGRLSYVLGAFAFGENVDARNLGGIFSAIPGPSDLIPASDERLEVDNRSLAAYAQLDFAITEALRLTVGLRRTAERKRVRKVDTALTATITQGPAGTKLFEFERSRRFGDWSPNVGLSYQLSPSSLLYASYATGFRSGGFNGRADVTNMDTGVLRPEDLTSYEVGFKTALLDDLVQLNAAAFFNVYEDIQRTIPTVGGVGPGGPGGAPIVVLRNAAEARIAGAELELVVSPFAGLRLESVLSSLRSRYTSFDLGPGPIPASLARVKDAALPAQPDFIMAFAAAYDFELSALGEMSSRLQWTHRGPQGNDVAESRSVRCARYGLLDARLGLALPDERTEIVLVGSNLLDRRYNNNGLDFSDSVGTATPFFGPPRRYGIEIKRRF